MCKEKCLVLPPVCDTPPEVGRLHNLKVAAIPATATSVTFGYSYSQIPLLEILAIQAAIQIRDCSQMTSAKRGEEGGG